MTKKAYTMGNQKQYDLLLKTSNNKPIKKLGRTNNYPGGCIWKSKLESAQYVTNTLLPFRAAIYELKLPNNWKTDVSKEKSEEGYYHLLNDSVILKKVLNFNYYKRKNGWKSKYKNE